MLLSHAQNARHDLFNDDSVVSFFIVAWHVNEGVADVLGFIAERMDNVVPLRPT
jgi:hypothetical protein